MHLASFDYFSDREDPKIGLSRTASLIREERKTAESDGALVLLLDNGDALQGAPMGEWAFGNPGHRHPLVTAFAALGYDAVGLGNHDFGFGLPFLNAVSAQAPYPVISSNAHCLSGTQSWRSSVVLQRQLACDGVASPIRIGVLSVLPPQTRMWEGHLIADKVCTTDILASARDQAISLRQQGCDLVIALAHTGLGQSEADEGLENAAIPLAAMPEIDLIIAGHTHLTLPGTAHEGLEHVDSSKGLVHGKPTVMPGWAGAYLGVIDLELRRVEAGGWDIIGSNVGLQAIAAASGRESVREDPEILRILAEGHLATRKMMSKPVARIKEPLHSYFSYCAEDRGMALVAAAQLAALRQSLTGALACLPILSATAPCKFGGRAGPDYYSDVPAGDISLRHLADIHMFPNALCAVVATGAQVRDWLDMSAGIYNQLSQHSVSDLIDPSRTGHNFDAIYGVSYEIDLSGPPRFDTLGRVINPGHSRIRNLTFDGRQVTADQRFVVALNNYRANGGGHFPIAHQSSQLDLPLSNIRDKLSDYIVAHADSLKPDQMRAPFSFAPLGGAQAILRTGPKARHFLNELDHFAPRDLGLDKDGFLQLQLSL